MRKQYKTYLHSDKSSNYELADYELNLNPKVKTNFSGSLYEVEFDMEVDTLTGYTFILAVNGMKLKEPVKG